MLNLLERLLLSIRVVAGICLVSATALMLPACRAPLPQPETTPTTASIPPEEEASCTYAASLDGELGDETLTVGPDQVVQQRWAVRNSGTCDWAGVTLVFLPDLEQGTAEGSPIPEASADSSAELALDFTAPSAAGDYVGTWRLQAPDGTLFGPTLRLEVIVQVISPGTPQSPYGVVTAAGCTLDATYVADITLADGAVVEPNQSLQKTWRVQNTGTCDWPEGVALVFVSGDLMSASAVTIPLTRSGGTADIPLDLTAPAENGTYTGWWRLQSTDGTLFGVSLSAQINVGAPAAAAVPDETPYTPYIHNISYHSRQIFLDGQSKGNFANVFTKVGDSMTDVPAFLTPIGDGNYALHNYAYLQPVINYFSEAAVRSGNSFNNKSLAAVWGWSSFDVLNPAKVADVCPGLTPLACEYSLVKPSVAIIQIGTNDAIPAYDRGVFEGNIRRIVETSVEYGVIPVLSTVPWDQFADVQPYNQVIIAMAVEYDVPWIDFYGATWDLDNHGISWEDGVHPSIPATNDPANFTPDNLHYGHTVRNLLVLHLLDAMWRQVLAY